MSPVFAEVGPDGAVWFADWQNFIIQHNPTPSVARGGYEAKTGVGGAHENPLRDHQSRAHLPRRGKGHARGDAQAARRRTDGGSRGGARIRDTQYWRLLAQGMIVDGKKSRRSVRR